MIEHYILNEDKEPVRVNPDTWAEWFSKNDRSVKKTDLNVVIDGKVIREVQVSTVFIGISIKVPSDKSLFETMVFGGPLDQTKIESSTWDKAVKTHEEMCEVVEITNQTFTL